MKKRLIQSVGFSVMWLFGCVYAQSNIIPLERGVLHQENWDTLIQRIRDAKTVYYRGLCLYRDRIVEVSARGDREMAKLVTEYFEKQEFESSNVEPIGYAAHSIGGWVRFYDKDGVEIATVNYFTNDFSIDLTENDCCIFRTKHHKANALMSNDEVPFNFFGDLMERPGWDDFWMLNDLGATPKRKEVRD